MSLFTFGETSVTGATSDGGGDSSYIIGVGYTAPSSGTLTKVSIYIWTTGGNLKLGVYSRSGDVLTLVGSTAEVAVGASGAWQDVSITGTIVSGTQYYICGRLSSDSITIGLIGNTPPVDGWTLGYATNWPATLSYAAKTFEDNVHWCIYATADDGVSGGAIAATNTAAVTTTANVKGAAAVVSSMSAGGSCGAAVKGAGALVSAIAPTVIVSGNVVGNSNVITSTNVASVTTAAAVKGAGVIASSIAAAGVDGAAVADRSVLFPLAKSSNGRHFVDSSGQPFPKLGRTLWAIVVGSQTEYRAAIDDTAAKGYNSSEIAAIWRDQRTARVPYANNGALLPFLKRLDGSDWDGNLSGSAPDFSTPNSAYFDFLEQIIDYAAAAGINLEMFPAYIGASGSYQGWNHEMVDNGATKMATYGTWIATRFAAKTNITWMLMGDNTPSGSLATVHDAMASAINAVTRASPYFSGENDSGLLTTDYAPVAALNCFNWAYHFGGAIIAECRNAYAYSPTTPAQLGEEPYDEEGPDGNNVNSNATQPVRRWQWWGWLSSIAGYCSGNGYIWPFNSGWQDHLNTVGAQDMARLNAFIRSIAWWTLVPDGLGGIGTLVTAGVGSGDGSAGTTTVTAAANPTGTLLVAYVPPDHTGTVTIDQTKMSATYRARWYDPTNATYTAIGSYANTGTRAFTTPGNNSAGAADWVLLLDIPGVTATITAAGAMAADVRGSGAVATVNPASVANANVAVVLVGAGAVASANTASVAQADAVTGTGAIASAGTSNGSESAAVVGVGAVASSSAASVTQTDAITGAGAIASAMTASAAWAALLSGLGGSAINAISTAGGSESAGITGTGAIASAVTVTGSASEVLAGLGTILSAITAAAVESSSVTATTVGAIASALTALGSESNTLLGLAQISSNIDASGSIQELIEGFGAIVATCPSAATASAQLTGAATIGATSSGVAVVTIRFGERFLTSKIWMTRTRTPTVTVVNLESNGNNMIGFGERLATTWSLEHATTELSFSYRIKSALDVWGDEQHYIYPCAEIEKLATPIGAAAESYTFTTPELTDPGIIVVRVFTDYGISSIVHSERIDDPDPAMPLLEAEAVAP